MPVGVHAFRQGQTLRRKAHPPGDGQVEFRPVYDGICCDTCGALRREGVAYEHARCVPFCAKCGRREPEHAAGWCLFRPTKWERFNFEWEGYR